MCEECGFIYSKLGSGKVNHWKKHFGDKPKALPWGQNPVFPMWVSHNGAGILELDDAHLTDLCDPEPITLYLENLLEDGTAIPNSFSKFGVMAVWRYFIKNHQMPELKV